MATFNQFSDLLPDPDNKINDAGVTDAAGNAGPGFLSLNFRSNQETQRSKTISGRGVNASPNSHSWEFDIRYNPLTRDQFEPVSSFLESRRGGLFPFFVILPQYNAPRESAFRAFALANTIRVNGAHLAGSNTLTIDASISISGNPKPGDFFHIVDAADANHTKTYKVLRVETPDLYQTGLPVSVGNRRVWTQPPLVRDVADNATVVFINPKFRVQQKSDVFEYNLETEGLFEFSLSLEEIQP